ncbi:MAG: carbohydrate kinase family protein [Candidatus Nanopelagicales bacterium]
MRICITGSVATDHLMSFPGSFTDSLVADQLHTLSLSFLVSDLQVRRGGVGANIAFGLANLGLEPLLVAAVGHDFDDYRSWLDRHGVNTMSVQVSEVAHTARFVCTTDAKQNQIASFYPGAMAEARNIELGPVAERFGGVDLVLIGPNDPDAMLRHTEECRERGLPFAADPSQQLAFMDGESIRRLIDGAEYLFTNEYEAALTEQKTGWSAQEILSRVGTRVTTLGKDGAKVETSAGEIARVAVPQEKRIADPTGVGDAFRSGYLAGVAWGLSPERSAQVGSMMATLVIETVGTQEYVLEPADFRQRFGAAYGDEAAADLAGVLA